MHTQPATNELVTERRRRYEHEARVRRGRGTRLMPVRGSGCGANH